MYKLAGYNKKSEFLEVLLTIPVEKLDRVKKIHGINEDSLYDRELSVDQVMAIAKIINEKINPDYDYFLEPHILNEAQQ